MCFSFWLILNVPFLAKPQAQARDIGHCARQDRTIGVLIIFPPTPTQHQPVGFTMTHIWFGGWLQHQQDTDTCSRGHSKQPLPECTQCPSPTGTSLGFPSRWSRLTKNQPGCRVVRGRGGQETQRGWEGPSGLLAPSYPSQAPRKKS